MLKPFGWIIIVALLFGVTACSLPGLDQNNGDIPPSAAISSPANNQTVELGQEIQVQSVSVDTEGIIKVELVVDDQVVWIDSNAQPEPNTPFIVNQPWTPETAGPHTIQIRTTNKANVTGVSAPLTIEVIDSSVAATPTGSESTAAAGQSDVVVLESADTPTPQPTSTPVPANTATPEPPQPTEPKPSPTITLTPTQTPAPQKFKPTGLEPDGRFKDIWIELGSGDSRLGYPNGPEIVDRNYARQFYENGLMIWWDNPETPDYIWVIDSPAPDLTSGTTSNLYPDTWEGGDDYSCDAARDGGPVRGFGKVWCDHPELETRLGYPIEPERGSGENPPYAKVQFFQGGVMIYNPINSEVYVLFAQGDWQKFGY